MHARLGRRLMSQRASHRFAIYGDVLFLLLPCLLGQSARFVLTPLSGFPPREASRHHLQQFLRIDPLQRIQIRSLTWHTRTPQVQLLDDPSFA